jgi:hypothetical protein
MNEINNILNKVITITGIETKLTNTGKTMLKLTDQENKHYQIWKTKADGTDSVAYNRLQELGEAVGKTIEIGYKEDSGEFQGKVITYKTIINIKPANGQQPQQTRANLAVKAQMSEAAKKTDDDKWTEISKGKVRHGVACEFIRLGAEFSPVTTAKIDKWVNYIMSGEIFTPNKTANDTVMEGIPTIDYGEDTASQEELRAENIPF